MAETTKSNITLRNKDGAELVVSKAINADNAQKSPVLNPINSWPITDASKDTISTWQTKVNNSTGVTLYNYGTGRVLSTSAFNYAFILNLTNGADVHQLAFEQAWGSLWHRSGNNGGWKWSGGSPTSTEGGTWKKILDTVNFDTECGINYLKLTGGGMSGNIMPVGESNLYLGNNDNRWYNIYTTSLNASGNAIISGSLTVNGTITGNVTGNVTGGTGTFSDKVTISGNNLIITGGDSTSLLTFKRTVEDSTQSYNIIRHYQGGNIAINAAGDTSKSSSVEPSAIYFGKNNTNAIDVLSGCYIIGTTCIRPGSDNNYNFGNSNYWWHTVFAHRYALKSYSSSENAWCMIPFGGTVSSDKEYLRWYKKYTDDSNPGLEFNPQSNTLRTGTINAKTKQQITFKPNDSTSYIFNGIDSNWTINYLPYTGGTMTGNLLFNTITLNDDTIYPLDTKGLLWLAGSDGARIFFRAHDKGKSSLIFALRDDGDEDFLWMSTAPYTNTTPNTLMRLSQYTPAGETGKRGELAVGKVVIEDGSLTLGTSTSKITITQTGSKLDLGGAELQLATVTTSSFKLGGYYGLDINTYNQNLNFSTGVSIEINSTAALEIMPLGEEKIKIHQPLQATDYNLQLTVNEQYREGISGPFDTAISLVATNRPGGEPDKVLNTLVIHKVHNAKKTNFAYAANEASILQNAKVARTEDDYESISAKRFGTTDNGIYAFMMDSVITDIGYLTGTILQIPTSEAYQTLLFIGDSSDSDNFGLWYRDEAAANWYQIIDSSNIYGYTINKNEPILSGPLKFSSTSANYIQWKRGSNAYVSLVVGTNTTDPVFSFKTHTTNGSPSAGTTLFSIGTSLVTSEVPLTVSSNLTVTGTGSVGSNLSVGGNLSVTNLSVTNNTTMRGSLQFTGNNSRELTWADGNVWQRIQTVDSNDEDAPIFNFQMSKDAGTSWRTLTSMYYNGTTNIYKSLNVGNNLSVTNNIYAGYGYSLFFGTEESASIGTIQGLIHFTLGPVINDHSTLLRLRRTKTGKNATSCNILGNFQNGNIYLNAAKVSDYEETYGQLCLGYNLTDAINILKNTYIINGSALYPYVTNSKDLGTSSNKWQNVYATNVVATNVQATDVQANSFGPESLKLYPQSGNELNFGGTATDDTIFFGCRAKDSKAIPSLFIFGGSEGTSTLKAGGLNIKNNATISGNLYVSNEVDANYLRTRLKTSITYGLNGLEYFNASLAPGNSTTVTCAPPNLNNALSWWHILRLNHSNSAGYFTEMFLPLNTQTQSIFYRVVANGNTNGWKKIVDQNNIISLAALPEKATPNRLAFINGNNVRIYHSTNSGSSWSEVSTTSYTTQQRTSLFSGISSTIRLGGNTTSAPANTLQSMRTRIVVKVGSPALVYTLFTKFVVFISTGGANGCWCTVEARLQSNINSNTDTWATFASQIPIDGWGKYNQIDLADNLQCIGDVTSSPESRYGEIRFTFGCTSNVANYTGLEIYNIYGFGQNTYVTPSNMANTGHIYSYDVNLNVTFPGTVAATSFSGTATTATNLASNPSMTFTAATSSSAGSTLKVTAGNKTSNEVTISKVREAFLADKASQLTTARNITIGEETKSFNGSGNIAFTPKNMGLYGGFIPSRFYTLTMTSSSAAGTWKKLASLQCSITTTPASSTWIGGSIIGTIIYSDSERGIELSYQIPFQVKFQFVDNDRVTDSAILYLPDWISSETGSSKKLFTRTDSLDIIRVVKLGINNYEVQVRLYNSYDFIQVSYQQYKLGTGTYLTSTFYEPSSLSDAIEGSAGTVVQSAADKEVSGVKAKNYSTLRDCVSYTNQVLSYDTPSFLTGQTGGTGSTAPGTGDIVSQWLSRGNMQLFNIGSKNKVIDLLSDLGLLLNLKADKDFYHIWMNKYSNGIAYRTGNNTGWHPDGSTGSWVKLLDSANSSVSTSGETVSVKINGSWGYAATSDHTHNTSITPDTGTSLLTLNHGGKYRLTTGGTSYIFTMPAALTLSSLGAAAASHNHSQITTAGDTRSINDIPNNYSNNLVFRGLKNNSTIGISNQGTYSYVVGLRGWSESSGGRAHELAFTSSGNIYHRSGETTEWNSGWAQLLSADPDGDVSIDGNLYLGTTIELGTEGRLKVGSNYANIGGKLTVDGDLDITGHITIGSGTIALENLPEHTHDVSILNSSNSPVTTLLHNTTYTLKIGSASCSFTTPTDNNTDTKVTLTLINSGLTTLPLLLSPNTTASTTTTAYKTSIEALGFIPSTGTLKASKFQGSGSLLTNLNASNLSSGTVPLERISGVVKYVGYKFQQHNNGNWTRILQFTVPEITTSSSISFTWHPCETARQIWADFNISIRLRDVAAGLNLLFYASWKGGSTRELKCVGDGTTFSVWVSGTKTSWDPYGHLQVTSYYNVDSFDYTNAYQDTDPVLGATYSGTAQATGYVPKAYAWSQSRQFTIGNQSISVNGAGDATWTLAGIGALPLSGGTMTGTITSKAASIIDVSYTAGDTTRSGNVLRNYANGNIGLSALPNASGDPSGVYLGYTNTNLILIFPNTTDNSGGFRFTRSEFIPLAIKTTTTTNGTTTTTYTQPNLGQSGDLYRWNTIYANSLNLYNNKVTLSTSALSFSTDQQINIGASDKRVGTTCSRSFEGLEICLIAGTRSNGGNFASSKRILIKSGAILLGTGSSNTSWENLATWDNADNFTFKRYIAFEQGSGISSDVRYKVNRQDLPSLEKFIEELPVFEYDWRKEGDDSYHTLGVSALDLEENDVLKHLVHTADDGTKTVEYSRLSVVALQVCKELIREKNDLEARLERLEKLVAEHLDKKN